MGDKVGGGDGRWTIASVEMRDNGDRGNRDTVICIQQWRRRGMGK